MDTPFNDFTNAEILDGIEEGIALVGSTAAMTGDISTYNTMMGVQFLIIELSNRLGTPTTVTKKVNSINN